MNNHFRRTIACAGVVSGVLLLCAISTFAQDPTALGSQPVDPTSAGAAPAAGAADPAGGPPAPVADAVASVPGTAWPPTPVPFFRGNAVPNSASSAAPQAGGYLSLFRLVFYIALLSFWVWSSAWVNEDSTSLKVRSDFWNSLMFGVGAAGLLLAITSPTFFLAFVLIGASTGTPLGFYVKERNSKVPDKAKVLTPEHIRRVGIRLLAKIGINIGGEGEVGSGKGPDIVFVGRTETGRIDTSRTKQVENSRGFMAAKEVVYDALIRRATDIHLEPR
ncbi:MAG: hypothetical protein ACKVHE_20450, partial [Planctomycetales bacterium]